MLATFKNNFFKYQLHLHVEYILPTKQRKTQGNVCKKKPFCKKREKTVGGVDMCRPCFCLIYFVVFRFPRCDMNIVKM